MVKQFLKYVVPSVLSMFVSSLYIIIDGMFVGQGVGDSALAAVNIIMPFNIMLFGIANMFAVGGGALVSKYLGEKNENSAVEVFRQVFKLLLIFSAAISLICVIFSNPLSRLLGATESIADLAATYLKFYAMFCVPNLIGIALNSFVRNDGRPTLAMISTISGAVTNIILDYVFIFVLSLGIKGAAIATGLGQIVTVSILIPHFLLKRGVLSFGVQPLISYNYGAKDKNKMTKFYNMTNIACLIVNVVFSGICFIFGRELIGIFTSNLEIIEITYLGLNLFNIGFFATGVNLTSTIYYQAIEVPSKSNLICLLRSIIVFPISLVLLSLMLNDFGIWASYLVSEVITLLVMMYVSNIKKATNLAVSFK